MPAHKATTRSWIRSHISVSLLVIRTANLVPFGVLQEVLDRRELGPGKGPIGWKTLFLGADPQRLLEARIGDDVLFSPIAYCSGGDSRESSPCPDIAGRDHKGTIALHETGAAGPWHCTRSSDPCPLCSSRP